MKHNITRIQKIEVPAIVVLILISVLATIAGIFSQTPFWDWAWARHQNTLSWFVRPLFIPALVYFAYRRSWWGILAVAVGTITSMYWFPAPLEPNDMVSGFLASEQDYLLGTWTIGKVLVSSLVPISLAALVYAFWKRSLRAGLAVINLIAFAKILWSVLYDPETGWAVIPFAIVGLIITDAAVFYFVKSKGIEVR